MEHFWIRATSFWLNAVPWILPYVLFELHRRATIRFPESAAEVVAGQVTLIFVTWILGLMAAYYAQDYSNGVFFLLNPEVDPFSEEAMRPDAPNVSAGWICCGWIPVLAGYLLTRRRKVAPVAPTGTNLPSVP